MRNWFNVLLASSLFLSCKTQSPSTAELSEAPQVSPVLNEASVSPSESARLIKQSEWNEIEKKISEQKYEEASKLVEVILRDSQEKKDRSNWLRAIVKLTQLRVGLHGFETAVQWLRAEKWPDDVVSGSIVRLYYAQSLQTYYANYSWEIRSREKLSTPNSDLKTWTSTDLFEEMLQTLAWIFERREELKDQKVADYSDLIDKGGYPDEIRGSLRDLATYLMVEALSNTGFWTPEQSNEVYLLSFQKLLGGGFLRFSEKDLRNPELHPLEKMLGLLSDLEAWHKKAGRREAAFEAHLEGLRQLFTYFPHFQEVIRKHLESALKEISQVPWWSMGMYQLAKFKEMSGDLVGAREVALQGKAKFEKSQGAEACRNLALRIEQPDYELQSMKSDGLGKASLQVFHKNIQKLYFRAYEVDLEKHIQKSKDYSLIPQWDQVKKLVDEEKPSVVWASDLPATPDFQMHRSFLVPELKKEAFYIIVASLREDFKRDAVSKLVAVPLLVSDLVLVRRTAPNADLEVRAYLGASGDSAKKGTEIQLYQYDWKSGHRIVEAKKIGELGSTVFKKKKGFDEKQYFLVAKSRGHLALEADAISFWSGEGPKEQASSFIYTDRSVYRPKQKLFFKVLAYKGSMARSNWSTAKAQSLTLSLFDQNHQKVASKLLSTNTFGTASGEFTIPEGRALGRWSLESSLSGAAYVQVEEYKRPTLEVKLEPPKNSLRLNEKVTYQGEARYYFGLPVSAGVAKWSVTRQPQYFYSGWNWRNPYRYSPRTGTETQIIASGKSKLEKDGTFKIEFNPEADPTLKNKKSPVNYNFRIVASVTDEGGETESATLSFRLGFVSVEAFIYPDVNFFVAGENGKIRVVRTNLSSVPQEGRGAYRLFELMPPEKTWLPVEIPVDPDSDDEDSEKRFFTSGDKKRARWETSFDLQTYLNRWQKRVKDLPPEIKLTHDQKGEALIELPKLKEGAYRIEYETQDEAGGIFKKSQNILVVSGQSHLKIPLILLPEKSTAYHPGEKVRLFVHSGLENQRLLFERFQKGLREKEEMAFGSLVNRAEGARVLSSLMEYPLTKRDRGSLTWSLSALRDHQWMSQSESIWVPYAEKELKIEFSKFRDKLRPKTKEILQLLVRAQNDKGKPELLKRTAEVLAYMYDRSLDSIAPHQYPRPLQVFSNHFGVPPYQTSLGVAYQLWSESSSILAIDGLPAFDHLKYLASYGIGGPGLRGHRGLHSRLISDEEAGKAEGLSIGAKQDKKSLEYSGLSKSMNANAKELKRGDQIFPKSPRERPADISELRSNFSETAFFFPHLKTNKKGEARIEFEVPDSVTSWNLWVHAITEDFASGSLSKTTETLKDLMVRPYLPRFLREGDEASIRVVVNNASKNALSGKLRFEIFDPETQKNLNADFNLQSPSVDFTAKAQDSTSLLFPIRIPKRAGLYAFKVMGKSGDFTDGEMRSLAVLPSRVQLSQSRFVALKDQTKREMSFPEMKKPEYASDSLVVTVNSQLFYSLLDSVPYLLNYPYDCTEQILNRFLSAGILSKVFQDFPSIKKMAQKLSDRKTPFEVWNLSDPNRNLLLEESPWMQVSNGSTENLASSINLLKSELAEVERTKALKKLGEVQTALGAFPWWAGGPPSPFVTLYILYGLSKATEFGIDVPKNMVKAGWDYLAKYYREFISDIASKKAVCIGCFEFLTFLNYVASNYPDPSWMEGSLKPEERKAILEYTFANWQALAPYTKGMLALTLKRMQRPHDAKLVFDAVMDSAKTTEDEGTFWAPEDRSWLWYNDTIETHAFSIKVLSELMPKDPRRDGLVQWLFLSKKLNHWKSTRATAEAIYSVVHYLKTEKLLDAQENLKIQIGPEKIDYHFDPEAYSAKNRQTVLKGKQINPETMSTILAEKDTKGVSFVSSTWHFSTDEIPTKGNGDLFSVERKYFKRMLKGSEYILEPLEKRGMLQAGDEVEVQLSIRSKSEAEYVHLRDPRAAGFEPESSRSGYKWELGLAYYQEIRDSGTNFFFEKLPVGEFTLKYRMKVAMAGDFKLGPATLQSMYAPEFTAYSAGEVIRIQ